MLRRRLFPPVAERAVPQGPGAREPCRASAGDFLFSPVGDRSRSAAHRWRRLEIAAAPLHQPLAHGAGPAADPARFRLGSNGPGLWRSVARDAGNEADTARSAGRRLSAAGTPDMTVAIR